MLRHKSAKVTLDTYSDLFDADLDAVAITLHTSYSPQIVARVWPQAVNDVVENSETPHQRELMESYGGGGGI
jgi:hypothetical protein